MIIYSVGGSDCQTEWEVGSKWQYYNLLMCTIELESLYLYIKQQIAGPGIDLRLLLVSVFLRLKYSLLFDCALCDGGRGTGG